MPDTPVRCASCDHFAAVAVALGETLHEVGLILTGREPQEPEEVIGAARRAVHQLNDSEEQQ